MVTISLCMIVRNEEDVLARCLDCVRGIADEVVVVDTGSSDATKEIAKRYTDRIYDFPWIDDFAAARNFSFDRAVMEYILWLDADDILLPPDQKAFLALKQSLDPSVDMVMMPYHVAFDSQGRPTMTYARERLLRRAYGYRWAGAVHEAIAPAGKILHAPIAVTHRKLRPGDADRNLRIFEKMRAQGQPLDPRQQFYYARELLYHARYQEAIRALTGFLDSGRGWVENNISACQDLAVCYQATAEPEKALAALCRSFRYDAPRAEVLCAIGQYFLDRAQYPSAVFWYQAAAAQTPRETGGFLSPDCYNFLPYLQLCVCYDRLGDRRTAMAYHEKAAQCKPDHPSVLYNAAYFAKRQQAEQ